MDRIVVVGASLAGLRTAESLRALGYVGSITVVGSEDELPYDRPPLSKGYLEGKRTAEQLSLRPSDPTYTAVNVDFVLGVTVSSANISARSISLSNGSELAFDGLVIATGTRVRSLPGTEGLNTVHSIRTRRDADRLKPSLVPDARIVIIGAGFIGAEVASTAHTLGAHVTVVEALPVPLSRQLGDDMGAAVAALHQRNGVQLHAGKSVRSVSNDSVALDDGTVLDADAIVVGIGVQPNSEWLDGNGLDLSNGVLCDDALRVVAQGTPLSNVVAVGDIARWTNPRYAYEGPVRVEHWTNAVESAQHAAATLLGSAQSFAPVPYFWSDQYGSKIQFLGRSAGFDEVQVVAGDLDGPFLALYRRGEQLVGALGVSKVKALMGYRQRLLDGCSWGDALSVAAG